MTREYISTTPISERSDRVQRKIYTHLDKLKHGKLTLWLKNRMAWDMEVSGAVAEILMPPLRQSSIAQIHYQFLRRAIETEFNKPSAFVKITGLSVP